MAKLVKMSVGYFPNKVLTNKKTGEKQQINMVLLVLHLDKDVAPLAINEISNFMGNRAQLNKDGASINILVPEDKVEIFIRGSLFQKIETVLEQKCDYVFSSNVIDDVLQRIQTAKDEYLGADKDSIDTITNKYIEDLVNGIEKDFNDPRFKEIMNSIHTLASFYGSNDSDEEDVILRETKLSIDNVLRVLSQWHAAGRTGIPTFLATANQWAVYFEGTVRNDALKLYIVRPDKVQGTTTSHVASQLNVNPNIAFNKGAAARGINMIARGGGMNKWRGAQTDYAMTVYYDISDVDNVDMSLISGKTSNVYSANSKDNNIDTNNGDIVDSSNNDVIDSENPVEDTIRKKLIKYATDNNIEGIKLGIQRDGVYGGLRYMVKNLKGIFRDRDAINKRDRIGQVMFIIIKHYGICQDWTNELYRRYVQVLRTKDGKPNKKLIYEIWAYAFDIISKLDGVNESVGGNLTLSDVIQYLGFTIDDYKNMPNSSNEGNEMIGEARETFIKIFNSLLR